MAGSTPHLNIDQRSKEHFDNVTQCQIIKNAGKEFFADLVTDISRQGMINGGFNVQRVDSIHVDIGRLLARSTVLQLSNLTTNRHFVIEELIIRLVPASLTVKKL